MKTKFYNDYNNVIVTKGIFKKVEAILTRCEVDRRTYGAYPVMRTLWKFEDGTWCYDMTELLERERIKSLNLIQYEHWK